jgi:quercetin dioxygenase-like cupin family protein
MIGELLFRRETTLVRRLRLAPGEAMPWHRDPYHRVTVVLSGEAIAIELREGGERQVIPVRPGQVDWDEPTGEVHRGVNAGAEPYEEVAIFFLDHPEADPQPVED